MENAIKRILSIFPILMFLSATAYSQLYGLGYETSDKEMENIPVTEYEFKGNNIRYPVRFSLKMFVPKVGFQDKCYTCAVWSTVYGARTMSYCINMGITIPDSIDKYTFSPSFVYRNISPPENDTCKKGVSVQGVDSFLKRKGDVFYMSDPLICEDKKNKILISSKDSLMSVKYNIKGIERINKVYKKINRKDIENVKKWLVAKRPIILSIRCYKSFQLVKGSFWTPPLDDSDLNGNHAMCIIGYDDSIRGGAFQIMNSWGTSWADSGFVWMDYEQIQKYGVNVFQLIEKDWEIPVFSGKMGFMMSDSTLMSVIKIDIDSDGHSIKDRKKVVSCEYIINNNSYNNAFKIKIKNSIASYLYVFSVDTNNEVQQGFPYYQSDNPYLEFNEKNIFLPDGRTKMYSIDTSYKSSFCVLISKSPIDIDKLNIVLKSDKISIYKALCKVFPYRMSENPKMIFDAKDPIHVGFNVKLKNESIVCFFYRFQNKL